MDYVTYHIRKLPIALVREEIVIPKTGNCYVWEGWKTSPWPRWASDGFRKPGWFEALKADIAKNGTRGPILLWDYAVVRGGSRLRAALDLGYNTVPALLCIPQGEVPPDGARPLAQIAHPAILGQEPTMIVWRKNSPLYFEVPHWLPTFEPLSDPEPSTPGPTSTDGPRE